MITLKEWMELVEYRITEGSEYFWTCFGNNSYCLSSWNGDHDGCSFNITFDTKDQTVFLVEACDYKHNRAYRLVNPDYQQAYREYGEKNNSMIDQAWDDVNYVDLESDDDFMQKGLAIREGEDYDTRVTIPIDLPDNELMVLFKAAHERDMKFNDYVEHILIGALSDEEFIGTLKSKLASKQ